MNESEVGKIEKYKVLKDEIARMWDTKEVIIISVVVGALGAISNGFEKYTAAIGIEMRVEYPQKKPLLRTARIFETGTWMSKKSIVIVIVQDSVRPLTAGSCPLSQNQLEQLTKML